jgi:hypothetical protein
MVKLGVELLIIVLYGFSNCFSSCFLTHFERFNPFSSTISKCFGYSLIEVCFSSSSVIDICIYKYIFKPNDVYIVYTGVYNQWVVTW